MTSGPGERVRFPPATCTPYFAASLREPCGNTVEVVERQLRRQHHRQQREARRRAHRRQIAQVHRQRPMTDGVGRDERAVEVHAFDDRVHREHFDAVPLRLHHGRIVTDTDQQPVGRGREMSLDARDELSLGAVGNDHFA